MRREEWERTRGMFIIALMSIAIAVGIYLQINPILFYCPAESCQKMVPFGMVNEWATVENGTTVWHAYHHNMEGIYLMLLALAFGIAALSVLAEPKPKEGS